MYLKIYFLVCLLFISAVKGQDDPPDKEGDQETSVGDVLVNPEEPFKTDKDEVVAYVKQYGYLRESHEHGLESLQGAIRNMQSFAGLQETGEINEETLKMTRTSRCGLADVEDGDTKDKRFVFSLKKWLNSTITYKIGNYPNKTEGMTEADVDQVIANSLKRWSNAEPNLIFIKVNSTMSSKFEFFWFSGLHTDKYPFDGPGRIFAHAFYPLISKIHFDDDETWAMNALIDPASLYLEYVATHEIGHALGLKHSNADISVMRAYYPGFKPDFSLTADDIDGIQALYG